MYHSPPPQPSVSLPWVLVVLILVPVGWVLLSQHSDEQIVISGWNRTMVMNAAQALVAKQPEAATFGGNAVPLGRGNPNTLRPSGNPLRSPNTVMTQGYGVGTHAPASVWGAIDLAIDSNGDGQADPQGSFDAPIYATHSGTIKVTPNSQPAGNHIWITNDSYRTGYAHLNRFSVKNGDLVEPGTLIGYIGSTGLSSGPHLDYQIWAWENGAWVNKNPLEFEPFGQ